VRSHELVEHLSDNLTVHLQGRGIVRQEQGFIGCRVQIPECVEIVRLGHVCYWLSFQHSGCATHMTARQVALNARHHLVSSASCHTSSVPNRMRVFVLKLQALLNS
jgi:hypothetical protein